MEEYYLQGDKEKIFNLKISPMCDRNLKIPIQDGQIKFYEFDVFFI